ncbi:AraC-type DNA-binding protein [Lishizhenia tianjinensis]|uniref:AraC-type DNA-binding protein n=1 Tax=Lishizhenia tianjinensis TaxID=477690 RepID=A0A1I6YTV6_9FLAO|nr:helix-turn-helix transcriptional regulator [Lishizhenia tianjinensis]SFT53935.1 AraC-type DNA-binding protein [Lishizhenia tianjinensis]
MQHIPSYSFADSGKPEKLVEVFPWEEKSFYNFEEMHAHTYNEIFIFLEGGGEHVMFGKMYQAQKGSFHILPASFPHKLKRSTDSKGFTLAFSNHFLEQLQVFHKETKLFNLIASPVTYTASSEEFEVFNFYFKELFSHRTDESLRLNLAAHILLKLSGNLNQHDEVDGVFVLEFMRLLNTSYHQKPNLSFYAEALGVSESKLSKMVKKNFGKTLHDMQNERILAKAKQLLLEDDLNIAQIAVSVNFFDEAHFSKFFKQHTGLTPTEFKQAEIYKE